jgi:subtilisin family serine protease
MKRWVMLGLLGLAACKQDKPIEQQLNCPGTDEDPVAAQALPLQGLADAASKAASGQERVLVRFKPRSGVSAMAAISSHAAEVERVGAQVKARFASLDVVAARVTPEQRRALEAHPGVEAVEPDKVVRAFGLPVLSGLPLLGATGSPGEYTEGLKQVQANRVWDADNNGELDPGAPTGQGIKVCVIDSGWDNRHPELQAVYAGGYDYVEDDNEPLDFNKETKTWGGGHGTHVAGIIAAQLGSGGSVAPGAEPNGMAGVAPGVQLYIVRVLDTQGNGNVSDVMRAMTWCRQQKVHIASLSLGSGTALESERKAFQEAWDAGILSIAASGNSGLADPQQSPPVAYPAAYSSVLAVGAVTFDNKHASFSQYGPEVALVAPGVNVLSSVIRDSTTYSLVKADGAEFASKSLEYATVGEYTGPLINCGKGDSNISCGENRCEGFVAYVDRGDILFGDKVRNVRKQGARAVIIGNNKADEPGEGFTLGAAGNWMPTAIVSESSASTVRTLFERQAQVQLRGIDYERLAGTSMATPHVSGVAALVWSANPGLTNAQVRDILQNSAKDLTDKDLGDTVGKDNYFGYGLVQACKAVELATGTPRPNCAQ